MKKIATIICAICVICGSFSCSDMLETDSTRQVFDPELNAKTDSVYYALGVLQAMQELADHYMFQGEMRGDLVQTTDYTDNNLRQLANFSATTANKYDSAYVYYRVINNCNYYVAHRDTTLRTGDTYVAMKEYVAMKAIRAWAYMQLARVYGKVPFYTQPLTQISQIDEGNFDELDMKGICDRLAPDLEQYTGYNVPDYGGNPATLFGSGFQTSRFFIPVDVVLGDLYLESGQYDKAARHYITYLTEVAADGDNTSGYMQPYTSRRNGNFSYVMMDDLPTDFDMRNLSSNDAVTWSSIFTSVPSNDVISFIPLAPSSRYGATTLIPLAYGYDFYANSRGYTDQIQIKPSDQYLALSDSVDYYYLSSTSDEQTTVINSAKLGDTRYSGIIHTETESDSTTVWIDKNRYANVVLYRATTVLLHLAEALNRLGMYDAAFAILKDGVNENIIKTEGGAAYVKPSTKLALQTTYPLLSNTSKFASDYAKYGVHMHGAGLVRDYYRDYQPGLTAYQPEAVIGKKMQELNQQFGIAVGTTPQDSVNAMEDLLCDEYALELAFEGSRFFDLCRLARHKNADTTYGSNFGGRWLAKKLANRHAVVSLEDENNWYLPFK